MSGPIVRKYGFPNFEKIFGHRDLQHGTEETETPAPDQAQEPSSPAGESVPAPKQAADAGTPESARTP
jgi:hypothetical protein